MRLSAQPSSSLTGEAVSRTGIARVAGSRWVWPSLLAAWFVARVVLFAQAATWTLPDSVKYLSEDVPLRLDGRTASPGWLILVLYRALPSNEARVWVQFFLASACWALSAWLISRLADRKWQQGAAAAVVLLVGLSLPVVSLDRVLQTESLSMSLTVLWLALWLNVLARDTVGLTPWWLALIMVLAVSIRPQLGLVMGFASIVLLAWRWYRVRGAPALILVPLAASMALTAWSGVVLAQFDRHNEHDSARAYFMSWYRGTDEGYADMERRLGRPECPSFDRLTQDTAEAAMHFSWSYYYNSYRIQCPELAAWHENAAPNYVERLIWAPGVSARLLLRDAPFLLQPWVRGDNPAPLGTVQGTVFGITDQSGLVNTDPQPRAHSALDSPRSQSPYSVKGVSLAPLWATAIWIAMGAMFAAIGHLRGLRARLRQGVGSLFLLAVCIMGVLASWAGDAWEMDRHSLPWSLLFQVLLVLAALITWRSQGGPGPPAEPRARPRAQQGVLWVCVAGTLIAGSWAQAAQEPVGAAPRPLPATHEQAEALRAQLRSVFLDNGETPNSDQVRDVQLAPLPQPVASLGPVVGLTARFTVDLRDGLAVSGFFLNPTGPSRCVVIFSGGHGPWWTESVSFIRRALKADCLVAALNMPLMDSPPTVSRNGVVTNVTTAFNDHFGLAALAEPDDNVLDLFVSGPLSVIDWAESHRPGQPVIMSGFSGGGFVTTAVAALDTRVVRSVAIAGSAGTVRSMNCFDDYEQCLPELVDRFSMEELYFLSAYGNYPPGRKRVAGQVLNEGDTCCHAGPANPPWVATVNRSLSRLGPDRFTYRLSTQSPPQHRIPDLAPAMLGAFVKEVATG